jgi:2-C-methyl-D-erythritol 4-phosphate cytidylyltransferase
MKVSLVEGEETNIKITRPVDLLLAEQILAEREA